MPKHPPVPLPERQPSTRLGIGYESIAYRYQKGNRTVTYEIKRCGLLGCCDLKSLNKLVKSLVKTYTRLRGFISHLSKAL